MRLPPVCRVAPFAVASPLLVDARNILEPSQARAAGFHYLCTGREHAVEPFTVDPAATPDTTQLTGSNAGLYMGERESAADRALEGAMGS